MLATPHPEVLAEDWLPPVALGREAEVQELVRRLDPPTPAAPAPWMVAVVGPHGSGTSTVARRAAREVADRLRTSGSGTLPRVIAVRTSHCRGTHGVASALLRVLDDGFDGRGFPVPEILAGFLRRLRREARPVVLVLDDVWVGGPDLVPVLRAVGDPDRFLPEGESGIPPVWTLLAGTADTIGRAETGLDGRWRIGPFLRLANWDPHGLQVLVSDRAERALGRTPPPELVRRSVERAVAEGGGAARAIDLLRRSLVARTVRVGGSGVAPRSPHLALPIESRVVQAIEGASGGLAARLGEIRAFEARLARAEGSVPLPATTLWRRIVRLEQAGYVRREVRPGGEGGTRSVLRVIAPVEDWVIAPSPPGTRPTSDGRDAWGSPEGWSGAGESRPTVALPRPGDEPD
jgi:hypothetical protein